ncbi:MAG: hypothetical protein H7138_00060, partial [Myxococcales bacterium]|nr:hypothetical protein [Myxococcales bacterium]
MLKPLKFAVSITLLLVTIALILRVLTLGETSRRLLAWTLALTMVVEMAAILGQALRGQASHFNTRTPFDAAVWTTMLVAILVAFGVLVVIAGIATVRPIQVEPVLAFAIRAGLWLLLLVAVSGFAMGGRGSHTVGAAGDLRVPHFFAMHGLQVLPVVALVSGRLPIGERARWVVVGTTALVWCA